MVETISNTNNNFLLFDKPVGWTSFDAVNFLRAKLRKETGNKKIKVGHAGTLDPFATGLLIVAVGRENTKRIDEFQKLPKTYVATIHLGATSDTQDSTGVITQMGDSRFRGNDKIKKDDVMSVLNNFIGKQLQTPPMYSAKKVDGQRLYKLARQGKEIKRKPVKIEIYNIKLLGYNWPLLQIEVQCSAGTYIRALAADIGAKLGCGAYCEQLRRTKIGEYDVENATCSGFPLSCLR